MPEFDMHVETFLMGAGEPLTTAAPKWKPKYKKMDCSACDQEKTVWCVCCIGFWGTLVSPCVAVWWCGNNAPWMCYGCPGGEAEQL